MDKTSSTPGKYAPILDLSPPVEDPLILGLERKLDVIRAQLAACRAGEDPGEAGVSTWSRLEHQSQQVCALRVEVGHLQGVVAELGTERNALLDRIAEIGAEASRLDDGMRHGQREILRKDIEATRMAEELGRNQQTIISLSQLLLEASLAPRSIVPVRPFRSRLPDPAPPVVSPAMPELVMPQPDDFMIHAREALLVAVLASTCWRATRPLRRLGNLLKGSRDPVN